MEGVREGSEGAGAQGDGAVGVVKAETAGIGAEVACFCKSMQGATWTQRPCLRQGEGGTKTEHQADWQGKRRRRCEPKRVTYNVSHGCIWRVASSPDPVSVGVKFRKQGPTAESIVCVDDSITVLKAKPEPSPSR
jgi:hypothetical protein